LLKCKLQLYLNRPNTNVIDTVKLCQDIFGFNLASVINVMIEKRRDEFLYRFKQFVLNLMVHYTLTIGIMCLL